LFTDEELPEEKKYYLALQHNSAAKPGLIKRVIIFKLVKKKSKLKNFSLLLE
jgi:hypothetical protein